MALLVAHHIFHVSGLRVKRTLEIKSYVVKVDSCDGGKPQRP